MKKFLKYFLKIIILIVSVLVVIYGIKLGFQRSDKLVYTDHLDEEAFSVDGQKVTLEDLSFYVLYEEKQVEDEAVIYNSDNTRDYWNAHVDGQWISITAKNTVADMAIHDVIFYNLAKENYTVFSTDDKKDIENRQQDFWEDLYDCQLDKLPTDKQQINETIEKIALAEKYQNKLAEQKDCNAFEYDFDGYRYKKMLKKHEVVYSKLWDKVRLGNITLTHNKVNYINGLTKEEEK